MDTLVLACTHFPLLHDELTTALGPDVALIDGSHGIAQRIAYLCEGEAKQANGSNLAVTTGPLEDFTKLRAALENHGLSRLERF